MPLELWYFCHIQYTSKQFSVVLVVPSMPQVCWKDRQLIENKHKASHYVETISSENKNSSVLVIQQKKGRNLTVCRLSLLQLIPPCVKSQNTGIRHWVLILRNPRMWPKIHRHTLFKKHTSLTNSVPNDLLPNPDQGITKLLGGLWLPRGVGWTKTWRPRNILSDIQCLTLSVVLHLLLS